MFFHRGVDSFAGDQNSGKLDKEMCKEQSRERQTQSFVLLGTGFTKE